MRDAFVAPWVPHLGDADRPESRGTGEAGRTFAGEEALPAVVAAKIEIYKLIFALAEQGIAIVLIFSDLSELLALSDRVAVLAEGRMTGEFGKAEGSAERTMLAATDGALAR